MVIYTYNHDSVDVQSHKSGMDVYPYNTGVVMYPYNHDAVDVYLHNSGVSMYSYN